MQHVYLIGPGGVGKTTVGPILAEQLTCPFVDLDRVFCETLGNIGAYIGERGYADYCVANARLFAAVVSNQSERTVIALSSGLMSPGGLPAIAAKNWATATASGILVLLLPGNDIAKGAEIIVARQLARGFGLRAAPERRKYMARAREYLKIADQRVDSTLDPAAIASAILQALGSESPNPFNPRKRNSG